LCPLCCPAAHADFRVENKCTYFRSVPKFVERGKFSGGDLTKAVDSGDWKVVEKMFTESTRRIDCTDKKTRTQTARTSTHTSSGA